MNRLYYVSILFVLGACAPGTQSSSDVSDLQASCEALVSAQTGVRASDVTAVSTQSVPTGSVTTVSVVGVEAPWLCQAGPTGVVFGVEYSQEG
ncbi:hypothetical protein [uncultured Ruegeria sp.]|jgi:hypothetical protein|uniref:hypothetical protein n=1 Tax=uncultured Ruegeria sp. TaxID=259304 RepID=UPI00260BD80D|nr:hypothetical protein [uncultured Ruegeria sp.]